MKFRLLIIAIIAVFLASCGGNKNASDNEFIISGKLMNTKKDSVYLEELTVKDAIPLDSAVINEDGEFSFKVKPKQIGFYVLRLARNNFVTLLIDKGETVEISGDARQLVKTYNVSGSKGSQQIKEINDHLRINYARVDSLSSVYEGSQGKDNFIKIKEELDSIYLTIFADQKKFASTFIDKNTSSLACLIAIYQQFGKQPVFDVKVKEDFAYFQKLDKAIFAAYPDNPHAQDLHERIAEIKKMDAEKKLAAGKLSEGASAPEIKLKSPEGTQIALSSLKGKFVLVDFWASWCSPCRKENPNLVKIYKKYKAKDFEIYGVSLDRDKDAWKAAIKTDKITWIQVSDLLYWDSPLVKLYNVEAVPFSVLIDKEGKIIAKGLTSEELDEKLGELLK
jgi:thiol-disulfide isomerase/thioredoxin